MKWSVDPILYLNSKVKLFHTQGEFGKFIQVSNDEVLIGEFHDAIPHITDACFDVRERISAHEADALDAIRNSDRISDSDFFSICNLDSELLNFAAEQKKGHSR